MIVQIFVLFAPFHGSGSIHPAPRPSSRRIPACPNRRRRGKRGPREAKTTARRRARFSLCLSLEIKKESRHHRPLPPPARGLPARRLLVRSPDLEAPETDLVSAHGVLLCVALFERNAARECRKRKSGERKQKKTLFFVDLDLDKTRPALSLSLSLSLLPSRQAAAICCGAPLSSLLNEI